MKETILFADNDRGIRNYCKQELEAEGFRVLLAGDGEGAAELAESVAVDLVVLDEHMPRCGGLEAARHIKQWRPQLPVILYTADEDYEQFTSPWIDTVVIKTDDPAALKAAAARLLASRRAAPTGSTAPQLCGTPREAGSLAGVRAER